MPLVYPNPMMRKVAKTPSINFVRATDIVISAGYERALGGAHMPQYLGTSCWIWADVLALAKQLLASVAGDAVEPEDWCQRHLYGMQDLVWRAGVL